MSTFDFAPTDDSVKLTLASLEVGSIDISDESLVVTMGEPPIFSTSIPRRSIRSAERLPDTSNPSRGVHGSRGRWLVNRAGTGLVRLDIRPAAQAKLTPPSVVKNAGRFVRFLTRERAIKLRQLTVSTAEPEQLIRELGF